MVVDKRTKKYASAHDLRRSFGCRWSRRVIPPLLQELMRHESIETTMQYYVGADAQRTAAELWQAESGLADTFADTQEKEAGGETAENEENPLFSSGI